MKGPYIRDDEGHAWFIENGAIRMVLAELEMEKIGEADQNGYPCSSWEEGVRLLNDYGYITGFDEPNQFPTITDEAIEPPSFVRAFSDILASLLRNGMK